MEAVPQEAAAPDAAVAALPGRVDVADSGALRARPGIAECDTLTMIQGFKDFLLRGNVVELAVAVVMGAALAALVDSFGEAFLNPLITLATGGVEVGGGFTVNGVEFPYGEFINGLLVFFLTALAVYFVIVLPFNKLRERLMTDREEEQVEREEQLVLLEQIRDALRADREA